MSEKKNNGNSFEVLMNVKHDKISYIPGDKISINNKEVSDPLILSGAIGGSGSFKKAKAEAEMVALGDSKDVKILVDDLKVEIMNLKKEKQGLQEHLAKKK